MSVLEQFGVGGDTVLANQAGFTYPKPVQGRVAHIDADFTSYQVSAESKDELSGEKPRKTFEDMCHNVKVAADHVMRMAAATSYVLHVTPSGSTKGGRSEQAIQQEYQGNRKDREKPEYLEAIRSFIVSDLGGRGHLDQEADDGMAQASYSADDPKLCIICSKDKDLRMVPGLHLDMYDGSISDVPRVGFGDLELVSKGSGKKVVGYGPVFFFAQCLMGDQADNIKGLPAVPGKLRCELMPTKAYDKLNQQYIEAPTEAKAQQYLAKMQDEWKKYTSCGPVKAYELLKDVRTARDAYNLVKRSFVDLGRECGYVFQHWNTGKIVTPTQALLGDMQLLWMRRNKNPRDVVDWLKAL